VLWLKSQWIRFTPESTGGTSFSDLSPCYDIVLLKLYYYFY